MTATTSRPTHAATRRRARRCGAVLLLAATTVLAAAPAHAEVPEGWSEPDDVSLLQLLTVVLAIPALLLAVIVAAVLLPALARGEKLLPGTAPADQWFGGPGGGTDQLESSSHRELGPTGGASGSW